MLFENRTLEPHYSDWFKLGFASVRRASIRHAKPYFAEPNSFLRQLHSHAADRNSPEDI